MGKLKDMIFSTGNQQEPTVRTLEEDFHCAYPTLGTVRITYNKTRGLYRVEKYDYKNYCIEPFWHQVSETVGTIEHAKQLMEQHRQLQKLEKDLATWEVVDEADV